MVFTTVSLWVGYSLVEDGAKGTQEQRRQNRQSNGESCPSSHPILPRATLLLGGSFQALQAAACSQATHGRPFQFVICIAVTQFVICQGNKCHAIQWQEIKSQPWSLILES